MDEIRLYGLLRDSFAFVAVAACSTGVLVASFLHLLDFLVALQFLDEDDLQSAFTVLT